MSDNLNVYQKIIEVRKEVKNFNKDTKGYNYQYVSGDQILNKIINKMNEIGLLFVSNIKENSLKLDRYSYVNSKGKEVTDSVVTGEIKYRWINAQNPEDTLEIEWGIFGQQSDPSQAFGTALTYSERYMLLKLLGVPTDGDDPDTNYNAERKTNSRQSYSNELSSPQLNRYYEIAKSKDIDKTSADILLKLKFNKSISELTKQEYDTLCNGIEKEPQRVKNYILKNQL